jgi:N-methylhydantoinase B
MPEPRFAAFLFNLERDPEAVRMDVMNDLVSVKSARDNYGIVFTEERWPFEIDLEATKKTREKLGK